MSHSDELDVLSRDTASLLTDAQATIVFVTPGAFSTATMKNATGTSSSSTVDCVRFATNTYEIAINGKPTKVKDTVWIVEATGLPRAPAENDKITLGSATYPIVHVSTEVGGRQYRITTRELG